MGTDGGGHRKYGDDPRRVTEVDVGQERPQRECQRIRQRREGGTGNGPVAGVASEDRVVAKRD